MTPRRPFTGCGTALVTPFTANGRIDEAAVRSLARRQIEAGMHFLVPVGTTGEAPTLSVAEKRLVVELVVDEAKGAVPVLAGAGGYNTAEVIEARPRGGRRRRHRHPLGLAVLQQADPGRHLPALRGDRLEHEPADRAVQRARAHRQQHRAGDHREARTLPQIVGIKEASGNVFQIADVRRRVPADFLVLSGDDTLTLPVMALGGEGVISVAGNEVPADMARMVESCERGDFAGARVIHERLLPLLQANFIESNPGPVKAVMALAGLLEPVYRLPLVAPTSASLQTLRRIALELGLLAETASA